MYLLDSFGSNFLIYCLFKLTILLYNYIIEDIYRVELVGSHESGMGEENEEGTGSRNNKDDNNI